MLFQIPFGKFTRIFIDVKKSMVLIMYSLYVHIYEKYLQKMYYRYSLLPAETNPLRKPVELR